MVRNLTIAVLTVALFVTTNALFSGTTAVAGTSTTQNDGPVGDGPGLGGGY